jgi:hypothetical protein
VRKKPAPEGGAGCYANQILLPGRYWIAGRAGGAHQLERRMQSAGALGAISRSNQVNLERVAMRNKVAVMLFSCAVGAVSGAQAQDENSPEAQAVVKQGEVAHLNHDSIGEYGDARRFDVSIAWNDAEGKRPADHQSRIVRYVANCKEGTLTVAAVGVFDRDGMLVKRMMLPPGAVDPTKPETGSPEARWLKDVCVN